MSTARTVAVFAIIVGCFAVLYPRIFHPFVLHMFGGQKSQGSDAPRQGRRPDAKRDGDDIRSHIRPGPHPGLRAAAEMRQQQQQAGGGRGMMGVVLPMYAVGIVLYLIYTIVKVFSKRQESRNDQADGTSQYRDYSYEQREEKFTFGDDFEPEDDYKDFMKKKEKQKELEKLLLKADERHITEFEMRQLQKRLEETEAQMTRILQAMQTVTTKVEGQGTRPPAGEGNEQGESKAQPESTDTCSSQSKDSEDTTAGTAEKTGSNDSTPDTDSFEVVSKTGSSSFSVISTPTDEDSPAIPQSEEAPSTTDPSDQTQKPADSETSLWENFENDVQEDDIDVLSTCKAGSEEVETETIGACPEGILLDKENKDSEESSVRQRKPNQL